jgi:hypothetical protein
VKLTSDARPRTKRDKERLRRELAATLRRQDREKLAALREALKLARKKRRQAMAAAVDFCRDGRRQVRERARERRLRALAELRAARETEALAARRACLEKKDAVRSRSGPTIDAAEKELAEARRERRSSAAVERSTRERERERGRRASSAERRAESDDAVRADLPPELVPVFDKVRKRIKPNARMSRAEVFLKWAEENPGEVVAIQDEDAERAVAELIREQRAAEKKLRSRKRYARSTEEISAELAKEEDEEVPF